MTTIPTIQEIFSDLLSKMEAEFDVTLSPALKKVLQVIAGVLAGIMKLYYISISAMQKNIWVDTCDYETLVRYGVIILGRYPFAPVAAQYTISVTGTAGAVIPVSTTFKSDDSSQSPGQLYVLNGAAYTMTGSGDIITINAVQGGIGYALAIGDTLTLTAPIPNVNQVGTVVAEVTQPTDVEDYEEYRIKVIDKIKLQPGGWSAIDYRLLGATIDGVFNTYAYAASGMPNEVNVFLQGETPVANPGPSASAGVIADYTAALELVRPLGVWRVNYASCPISNVDVTIIQGSFPAFTLAQKGAISIALEQFINSVKPFIAACDTVEGINDVIATYNLSSVISAAVPGYGFAGVTFEINSVISIFWRANLGNIPFFNSITYA